MTYQHEYGTSLNGLPDPTTQAAFYQGVPFKRAVAWLLDGTIVFFFTLLVSVFTLLVSVLTLGLGSFIFFGTWAVLAFLYRVATLSNRSSTWGMRMMSMELRRGNGERFDGGTALLHTVGTYLCFATGLQIVSVLMMLFTQRGQGLPDMFLSTTAVNTKARY